jgi:hypothetical protein
MKQDAVEKFTSELLLFYMDWKRLEDQHREGTE